jgi:hypothetical protein
MRQSELFIGRTSDKLSWDLLALDRKHAGNRVVNWPLHIEAAPTYHGHLAKRQAQEMWMGGGILLLSLCLRPALARHRTKVFDSAWPEFIDIKTSSFRLVLALEVWSGLSERP